MPAQRSIIKQGHETRGAPSANKFKPHDGTMQKPVAPPADKAEPYKGTIRESTAPYKSTIRGAAAYLRRPEVEAPNDAKWVSLKRRMPESSDSPAKRVKQVLATLKRP